MLTKVIFKEDPKNGLVRVVPEVAGVSGVHTSESPVKNVLKSEKKRFKFDQGKVQVQDGHLEETICLKLAIYI